MTILVGRATRNEHFGKFFDVHKSARHNCLCSDRASIINRLKSRHIFLRISETVPTVGVFFFSSPFLMVNVVEIRVQTVENRSVSNFGKKNLLSTERWNCFYKDYLFRKIF